MGRFVLVETIILISAILVSACQSAIQTEILSSPSIVTEPVAQPSPSPIPTNTSHKTLQLGLDLLSAQEIVVNVYKEVNPSVVSIRANLPNGRSLGSGFVIDREGHIVTNFHVVNDQHEVEVKFLDGLKAHGIVIGKDQDADLAVIKVPDDVGQLHPVKMGDSNFVEVGQFVIAIGSSLGFEGTATKGIVSGLGSARSSFGILSEKEAFSLGDVIRTDAAITPGNSGGPLLNLEGEVIGVNASILTSGYTMAIPGIGYAISINLVKRIVPSLISKGFFEYPYLGISFVGDLTLSELQVLKLPSLKGVYVVGVIPGSPADLAGIRAGTKPTSLPGVKAGGDLIVSVDGWQVDNPNDLVVYLVKNKQPGEVVMLEVLRGEEVLELACTLGTHPMQ